MRKFIAILSVLVIVVSADYTVKAAIKSGSLVLPGLSFSGTTATCSLEVYAPHASDTIVASVILRRGKSIVKQWTNLTDIGDMDFSDTATVSHGQTYTMQVTLSVNGIPYTIADIVKTCP